MQKRLTWLIALIFSLIIHIPAVHADENTRITLNQQNADIRDVLQTMAANANIKMVIDTTVAGKISTQFTNSAFIEALSSVTLQAGYTYEKKGDVYVIGRPGQMPELNASGIISGVKPMIIKLKYLKPDEMKTALGTVVPEDRIRIEPTNRALVISGSEDDYALIKEMIDKLDTPPKQIMFEAEIVEIASSKTKNFGVDWNWSSFPSPGFSTDLPGIFTINKDKGYTITYRSMLKAMVEQENAKILANPRVAALDGQTAQILIGDRLPVQTSTVVNGVQQFNINYVDVGIKLEVTPRVNEAGIITTYIRPEVSYNLAQSNQNPSIRTRQAETTLRVKDGQTIAIGGLIQKKNNITVKKQPLLGDLPLVGHLFKTTDTDNEETELVIFITPKIMTF